MLGIKYVIKNKLQNNKKHNNNARSTLVTCSEKPAINNRVIIGSWPTRPRMSRESLLLTLAHYNRGLQPYL